MAAVARHPLGGAMLAARAPGLFWPGRNSTPASAGGSPAGSRRSRRCRSCACSIHVFREILQDSGARDSGRQVGHRAVAGPVQSLIGTSGYEDRRRQALNTGG